MKTIASKRACLLLAVGLGTVLALILTSLCSFGRICEQVRSETLRLHVLANSDSEADQQLKLKVRDAVVAECGELFGEAGTLAEAERTADESLVKIANTAQRVVEQEGYTYPVRVLRTNMYFSTRYYENFTLPAGRYDAIRVEIGAAKGKNWWCVLFPPLCIPAAESGEDAEKVYGQQGADVVEGRYEVRFAVVEWVEHLREQMRR